MAKYKLTETGVLDTETGVYIPNASDNRHWQEYQEWLSGSPSNVPDPATDNTADWDSEGRGVRNTKLAATDWTRLDDVPGLDTGSPTKREEFASYRQALRDLPATYPDYTTVVWPDEPTV